MENMGNLYLVEILSFFSGSRYMILPELFIILSIDFFIDLFTDLSIDIYIDLSLDIYINLSFNLRSIYY